MLIKIPDQYYVGIRGQAKDEATLPLAFATPFAEDSAFQKRKSTVDSWVGNHKPAKFLTIPNVLIEGFRISKSVKRHGWGSKGNVVWRIEDPRGFELEITSANFAQIVSACTITNGMISGKCVWGREGATNILLPEASEPYQAATKFTKLAKQGVNKKDLIPGQYLKMKDDAVVVYLGDYYALALAVNTSQSNAMELSMRSIKRSVFINAVDGKAPNLVDPSQADWEKVFAASNVTGVAAILDNAVECDIHAISKWIDKNNRKRYGNRVFPATVTAVETSPFKKITTSVVDGAINGSLRLLRDPQGVVKVIDYNTFHTDDYYGASQKFASNLRYVAYTFTPEALFASSPIPREEYSGCLKSTFATWKPLTLVVTFVGADKPYPVMGSPAHDDTRPMTRQSYTVGWGENKRLVYND